VAPFSTTDTIVAIATPRGRGALGVVRLSGPEALAIALSLLGRERPLAARRSTFARVNLRQTGVSDQVVVTWFPAPASYTGDSCVEISAHGASIVLDGIVSEAVARGARRAGPGEFTLRAFVHGRMDLTQAEAVADLTAAVTPRQAHAAFEQLEGRLGAAIDGLSARVLDLAASLEASLDFPEEGYHFAERAATAAAVGGVRAEIEALLAGAKAGALLRDGATVVVTGRPNTGKSSLFNALLRVERAIVSHEAGTTRDVLIESFDLNGLRVTLIDTAGRRVSSDAVEAEGVRRAERAVAAGDLEVLVLDGSEALREEDRQLLALRPAARIVAVNKSDLPEAWGLGVLGEERAVRVSALTGDGLADLARSIENALGAGAPGRDVPPVTNARHAELLVRANEALGRAAELVACASAEELVLVELHAARAALEEVTGARSTDDVLAHIFARFCIGK
jgi:tRNA modification GTPase